MRKQLVGYLQEHHQVSQRRACRIIPISRKAVRSEATRPQRDARLMSRLKALGEQYPRYGYLMLHGLLRGEGLVVNRKRTYRLYTGLGMQVRTKRRKKLVRPRVPMRGPTRPNERWSLDFVHDQLADGRRFRILNIVDDCSRVCVGQLVDLSISGARMALPRAAQGDAWAAQNAGARQWPGNDEQGHVFLEPGSESKTAFYPARQADPECFC